MDQADQVVPSDYFNGLVASAAGSLSAGDLADLWDSLWLLLMAAADGKLSENFSPLENEWDRQDQLRWFSRDDPPPLQWRHWRPGKIREMEPTTQRALELRMREKWAERLLAHFAPFAEHIAYMQDILGELDYMTEQEAYGKCERCFKRHGLPADWALETGRGPHAAGGLGLLGGLRL